MNRLVPSTTVPSAPAASPTTGSVPDGTASARAILLDLGPRGTAAVAAVRSAFVAGVPPLQVVGSASAADYLTRFGPSTASRAAVMASARFGLATAPVGSLAAPPRPELDRVEVGSDSSVGILDSFHTDVIFSLGLEEAPAAGTVQIFRADVGPVPGVIRPAASALSQMVPDRNTRKNIDPISISAFRTDAAGGGTRVTDMIVADPQLGSRVAISSASMALDVPLPATNVSRPAGTGDLLTVANVDQSVLNPLPRTRLRGVGSNAFFLTQRALNGPDDHSPSELPVGQRSGINVLQGGSISAGSVVQGSNAARYTLIATVPTSQGKIVGSFYEYDHTDPSVIYGRRYSYYVVATNSSGSRSLRSRLVSVDVVSTVPPPPPSLSFTVGARMRNDPRPIPRFTVDCGHIFADHVEVFRKGGTLPDTVNILSTADSLVSVGTTSVQENGFYHIGDVPLGPDRTVSFLDRTVLGGESLDYRFYTVDAFGLKSQTPASCSLFLPEEGGHYIPLRTPTVSAEQIPGAATIRVLISSDDPRAVGATIARSIPSQFEHGFHGPNDPEMSKIGNGTSAKRARSRVLPMMFGPAQWKGYLQLVSGTAEFLDKALAYDRVYQYTAVAVGPGGQQSSSAFSTKVAVRTKPLIERPRAVRVNVVTLAGLPTGVKVSWSGSTQDFIPSQLVASQGDLTDSAVRSVYQVERRSLGGQWEAMPATTESHFVDPISAEEHPPFRPKFAELLRAYEYRVIAMQSGGFISPYSDPVGITVEPPVGAPDIVFVRSTSLAVRPLSIVVSWDYQTGSVDRWHVERAAVNKFFGARLVSVNSDAVRGLTYSRIADVPRESSRARQLGFDAAVRDPSIFVGNRFYVDADVTPANSYFYRIRAVLPSGTPSDWTYAGISLNDFAHDRKLLSAVSDVEKLRFTSDPRPLLPLGKR